MLTIDRNADVRLIMPDQEGTNTQLSRPSALRVAPITMEIRAQARSLVPFLRSFAIRTRAVGFREIMTISSIGGEIGCTGGFIDPLKLELELAACACAPQIDPSTVSLCTGLDRTYDWANACKCKCLDPFPSEGVQAQGKAVDLARCSCTSTVGS
jgi:hypothetical protein